MESRDEIVWREEEWPIDKLRAYEKNPRKITPAQRATLKDAIVKLGYHNPVAAQPDGLIISGHQRWEVLRNDLRRDTIRVLLPSRELTSQEFQQMLIQGNVTNGEFDWDVVRTDFKQIDLLEWGVPVGWFKKDKQTKNAANVDFGGDRFLLLIECNSEKDLEKLFEKMTKDGHKCKIMS